MGSYARKVKRNSIEKPKVPRCCGKHMVMNKYGLWQCRKCGRQKFDIGGNITDANMENTVDVANTLNE